MAAASSCQLQNNTMIQTTCDPSSVLCICLWLNLIESKIHKGAQADGTSFLQASTGDIFFYLCKMRGIASDNTSACF